MFFALAISALAAGAIWVYVIPSLQNMLPATWTSNQYAQVAITGVFILATVTAMTYVLRTLKLKSKTLL
jgi:hypothetical protein